LGVAKAHRARFTLRDVSSELSAEESRVPAIAESTSPNALASLSREPKIAYFSMEIGLESDLPTYSGGLGVLAGDTLKSSSDLALPMVAVSLLYRKGYFRQELDFDGWQKEHAVDWNPG
jgi:glucan phosphorylase